MLRFSLKIQLRPLFFRLMLYFLSKKQYLRIMKMKIAWKRVVLFVIISLGLILITKSWLMTAGLLLLLLALDIYLAKWEKKHQQPQ